MSSKDGFTHRRRAFARAGAALTLCAVVATTGCVDPDEGGVPDAFDPVDPTSSTGTSGQLSYPLGPYGVARGQTIQDFAFSGFVNPAVSASSLAPLRLGDFYNPSRDASFEEGSPYGAGAPKPRAIAIVVGAVWCAPCQQEARSDLPEHYEILKPLGGELFFVLAEASQPGVRASQQDLERWTDTFDVDYPSVLDQDNVLGSVIKSDSYPANVLVDTRDMSIVDVVSGIPPESYWDAFEALARGQ